MQLENSSTERFRLIREVRPAAVSDKNTRKAHINNHILADTITDFNLRFLLNGKWVDEWSGSSGRAFPEAVELSLGLVDEEESIHRFRSAIAVSKRQQ